MRNKRFIAGAVCPSCKGQDKLFTFEEDDQKWRACAVCDFREAFEEFAKSSGLQELPTRVNQNKLGETPLAHETTVEVVKLLDPNK